jgi:hypothetical protein
MIQLTGTDNGAHKATVPRRDLGAEKRSASFVSSTVFASHTIIFRQFEPTTSVGIIWLPFMRPMI